MDRSCLDRSSYGNTRCEPELFHGRASDYSNKRKAAVDCYSRQRAEQDDRVNGPDKMIPRTTPRDASFQHNVF